jgi:hypothetical protein
MENTSEEAKQRAKNYMSLKGALEPKTMNKTAMQKLIDYMEENYHLTEESRSEFKKALEMERMQIINTYIDASPRLEDVTKEAAEDYYDKTYGKLPIEPTEQKPSNHINIGGCF